MAYTYIPANLNWIGNIPGILRFSLWICLLNGFKPNLNLLGNILVLSNINRTWSYSVNKSLANFSFMTIFWVEPSKQRGWDQFDACFVWFIHLLNMNHIVVFIFVLMEVKFMPRLLCIRIINRSKKYCIPYFCEDLCKVHLLETRKTPNLPSFCLHSLPSFLASSPSFDYQMPKPRFSFAININSIGK